MLGYTEKKNPQQQNPQTVSVMEMREKSKEVVNYAVVLVQLRVELESCVKTNHLLIIF